MKLNEIIRHIFGYLIGFSLFILIIPYGIYKLSIYLNAFSGLIISNHLYFRLIISVPIFLTGVIFAIWSNIDLFKIGKGGPTDAFGVTISPRTRHLVVEGPYKYSRNPMVFGTFACYSALCIFFNSIAALIILLLLLFIMVIYLKNSEEKRLLSDFGNEYIQYKKRVSIIIPLPEKKK